MSSVFQLQRVIIGFVVILQLLTTLGADEELVLQQAGQKSYCNDSGFVTEAYLPTVHPSDPCQVCWCRNSATVCKRLKCQKVECDYSAGESLTLDPNNCCPICSGSRRGCHHQGHVAHHNEVWQPNKCQTCYCLDGEVFCKQDICQEKVCPIGYVLLDKPDACCSTCIRAGRTGLPCIHSGRSYSDGDTWQSTPCTLCHCNRGVVQCYLEECAPKTCNQNETSVIPSGECCPVCIGFPCTSGNEEYQSGAKWNPSPCEHCACNNGKPNCFNEVCDNQPCGQSEKRIQLHDSCCPSCVSINPPCNYENVTHFDGEMWKINACDFCICNQGEIICHTATCSLLICHEGEDLVHKLGKCCAECVLRKTCADNAGRIRDDGDVWKASPCQLCRCTRGQVHCHATVCAGCPKGFIPISVKDHCCPLCRRMWCSPDCQKCDRLHPKQCLSCVDKHHVVQDGQCLLNCNKAHFLNTLGVCRRCHHTCLTCSGPSQHHCTDCPLHHLHFNGQCLKQCPEGFYEHKNSCRACHHSCLNCSGPADTDCTSCSAFENLLELNRCMEKCDQSFYMKRSGYCDACDASCQTCASDGTRCTSCHHGEYLQEMKCVEKCEVGFHPTGDGICSSCYLSCAECRGPTALQCTRCHLGHVLLDGQCLLDNCFDGFYINDGVCKVCHISCRICVGPSENHCLSCARPEESLVRIANQEHGFCIDVCPTGFYRSLQNTCEVCNGACLTCRLPGPTNCVSCPEPLLLRRGQCVADCGKHFFRDGRFCQDCHPSCAVCYGKKAQDCASCRDGEYLLMSGRCSAPCRSGQYMDQNRTCQSCDDSCKECFVNPHSTGSLCSVCKKTRHYPQRHECVARCGSGFFLTDGLCEACHESCATCDSGGLSGCTSCQRGYVLTHLGTCSTDCFDGYYSNAGVCYVCATNCLYCSSDGRCEKCRNPTMVVAFGECVSHCPDQHYADKQGVCRECSWACSACRGSASSDCISCMTGFLLQNGTCVKQCSDGYYRIGAVCRACNTVCKTCFGPGLSCTSCHFPELLLDGTCSLWCGFRRFSNTTTQVCDACPENCAQCSSRTQCEVCLNGYILKINSCRKLCSNEDCAKYEKQLLCESNLFALLFVPNHQLLVYVGEWSSLEGLVSNASNYKDNRALDTTTFWVMNSPANGFLVYLSDGHQHILNKGSGFTLSQLRSGRVGFVHMLGLPLTGYVQLGTSLEGSCPLYTVSVKVLSRYSPEVLTNQPLVLRQGQYKAIGSDVLDVEDLDNEHDVVVEIVEGPVHGSIVNVANHQSNISSFRVKDLRQETLLYIPFSLERKNDFVVLQLTDGYHTKNLVFNIHIIPKPQDGPVLVRNSDALVEFGGTVVINKECLQAVDTSSARNDVSFVLKPQHRNPKRGTLMAKHALVLPSTIGSESRIQGAEEIPVYEFKQSEVNAGKIIYKHSGAHEDAEDHFTFEVKDSADPPNILTSQKFTIKVDVQNNRSLHNNSIPKLSSHSQRTIKVLRNEVTVLTGRHLTYSGPNIKPGDIVYTLIQPLQLDVGSFEHADQFGIPVASFTQSDINAHKILFRPVPFTGELPRQHHIGFSVSAYSHQRKVTLENQLLNIEILSSNLVEPSFRVHHPVLTVSRSGSILIDASYFSVQDPDTSPTDLVFTIKAQPKFGNVVLSNQGEQILMVNGTDFKYEDILQSGFMYVNDGISLRDDEFVVTVADGKFNDSLHFHIVVESIEGGNSLSDETTSSYFTTDISNVEEIKFLTTNYLPHVGLGNQTIPNKHKKDKASKFPITVITKALKHLEEKDSTVFGFITEQNLIINETDVFPHLFAYNVTVAPYHGYLELVTNPGVPIKIFTHADIKQKYIRYILKSRQVDVTADQFSFVISNAKMNIAAMDTLSILWSWISFSQKHFTVGEMDGVIRIKVRRYGQLGEYAVIQCETEEGNAMSSVLEKADFISYSGQVQFDRGDEEKECTIAIIDNAEFEGPETFYVKLTQPVYAVIGEVNTATVTIDDSEDEPVLAFSQNTYYTKETEDVFSATIVRSGDVTKSVSAVCYTVSQTAIGGTTVLSGIDFISRTRGEKSRITLESGVSKASCDIKLVEDSEYEKSEKFEIILSDSSEHCKVGNVSMATVIIQGPNNEVIVQFASILYTFEEKHADAEIELLRYGPDLTKPTTVWCSTSVSEPPSAIPSSDFVSSSKQVIFAPKQSKAICSITLLDDDDDPRLEGNETFNVKLSSSVGGVIGKPSAAAVIIMDADTDAPLLKFSQSEIKVSETNQTIEIPIIRKGDVHFRSSVRCFTRQKSAHAGKDFEERPNTEASRIIFYPGEKQKNCAVTMINDAVYEPVEHFIVKLKDARGQAEVILGLDTVKVFITNEEDVPIVQFKKNTYNILEPLTADKLSILAIELVRQGDTSKACSVRVSTLDGSARSGVDYHANSRKVEFKPGEALKTFEVNVLYNKKREWHENFSVLLSSDEAINVGIGRLSSATVTILDSDDSGSQIMPAAPIVVSLMDYDNIEDALNVSLSPGYPLVCVTSCDPHFPTFSVTGPLCHEAGINQSSVVFSWEIAMPTETNNDIYLPFTLITHSTLFASNHHVVLDSIYFRPRFQVRCVVRPLHNNGNIGIALRSKPVTIGTENGICHTPIRAGDLSGSQRQTFVTSLKYVKPKDKIHPNRIHAHVEIPHQDGMLPILSTFPLYNLELLLAEPLYQQQHVCSNLIAALHGNNSRSFIQWPNSATISLPSTKDVVWPYQFDAKVRESQSLLLYKHLNLKSCLWTFDAYFHMTELVDLCGGSVFSNFQVRNASQSFVTVELPLYVTYVYAAAPSGWTFVEHRTDLEVSFHYHTILWRPGVNTDNVIGARIQVLRVSTGQDGQLVIEFKTEAQFRGQFVLAHESLPNIYSRVLPPNLITTEFNLDLIWSSATFDGPTQMWQASSMYSLKDYSGQYTIELIPCTVAVGKLYTIQNEVEKFCTAHLPERYELQITYQQTNRPVPVVYTLNTSFHIINNEALFLSDPSFVKDGSDMDYTGSFSAGQTVYGRVMWHPDQNLESSYKLEIEQLYLCTGQDDYEPTYDPTGTVYGDGPQFGCIYPHKNLKFRILLLDRHAARNGHNEVQIAPFDAKFASDHVGHHTISTYPGVDGFSFKVDALYSVYSGQQWFLQVIYYIGSSHSGHRVRRYSELDSLKRLSQLKDASSGTNMKAFNLEPINTMYPDVSSLSNLSLLAVLLSSLLIVVIVMVAIVFLARQRKRVETSSRIMVPTITEENKCNLHKAAQQRHSRHLDRRKRKRYLQAATPTLNSNFTHIAIKVRTLPMTVRNNLSNPNLTEV